MIATTGQFDSRTDDIIHWVTTTASSEDGTASSGPSRIHAVCGLVAAMHMMPEYFKPEPVEQIKWVFKDALWHRNRFYKPQARPRSIQFNGVRMYKG